MNSQEAVARLFAHADSETPDSFSALLKSTPCSQWMQRIETDLMACLDVLERGINGRKPLETQDDIPTAIDRDTVLAVTTIISLGWNHYQRQIGGKTKDEINPLAEFLKRFSERWESILEGEVE